MKNKYCQESLHFRGTTRNSILIGLLAFIQICFLSNTVRAQDRGAQMPYTRYEAEDAALGTGAHLHGPTYDQTLLESEASNRKYVSLDTTGASVQWIATEEAEGLVLRFSIPDSTKGGGINRLLSLYVNGVRIKELQLTSKFAWQYFDVNNNPSNDPSVGRPRMRFDEYRTVLPDTIFAGDTIKIQRDANDTAQYYGIDFIELEPIPAKIQKPAGYLSVTDYGAVPDDNTNDFVAFNNCITAAVNAHVGMYIPKGRYIINGVLTLKSNLTIQGSGIWYTDLYFSSTASGGLSGNGTNIRVSNLYMECANTQRQTYRGLGGYWGTGSKVDSVWLTHFETGAWIANYSTSSLTDSLTISHCRIRNTYADGCNFARGTKHSVLEYCNIRNTGDDAMATWSSDSSVAPACTGNIFRYNTVENSFRASGLGIYGGGGHTAHHCIIKDNLYDDGIKVNSIFAAHLFSDTDYINIYDMTLDRTSPTTEWNSDEGAISLASVYYKVRNIKFDSIDINGSGHNGIYISGTASQSITDVHFNDINMNNVTDYGIYVTNSSIGWGAKANITYNSPGSGVIFNQSSFVFRVEGIQVLTINHTGLGSVTLDPAGGSYSTGTKVKLTAVPDSGYSFSKWSGNLAGIVNPDSIIMDDYKTVTANFIKIVAINQYQNEKKDVTCYPNPADDQTTVYFNGAAFENIAIFDCTGRESMKVIVNPEASEYNLNLEGLKSGIYFMKLTGDRATQVVKIIKN